MVTCIFVYYNGHVEGQPDNYVWRYESIDLYDLGEFLMLYSQWDTPETVIFV